MSAKRLWKLGFMKALVRVVKAASRTT